MSSRRKTVTPHRRFHVFRNMMTAAFVLLSIRLVWVQLIERGKILTLAENQHHLIVQLPAERGKILDRNGTPLAVNLPSVTVVANADSIRDAYRVGHRLASIIHQPPEEIIAKLRGGKGWVEIARRLPLEVKEKIEQADLDFVGCREELQRCYPKGRTAAQIVGFTRSDGVGAYGLESRCDQLLRGRPGKAVLLRTGRARVFFSPFHSISRPENGCDLLLTIDARYQQIAQQELERAVEEYDAKGGSVVILKPTTGEVLALSSLPTFDPNRWSAFSEVSWKPAAVTDQYEPGSTFKVVIMAAMLDAGYVTPQDQVFCENGKWTIYGHTIEDTKKYGRLTVEDVLVYSSNIGMAKLAKGFDKLRLYAYAENFGFGKPTGIDLYGEIVGRLRPVTDWSAMTPLAMSFGHETAVTPLQMATVFSTIANGGVYVAPRLLLAVAENGKYGRPNVDRDVHRVISAKTAAMLSDMMAQVVERGTGTQAAIKGARVCGKTGTARVVLANGGGYAEGRYISSFGGFFPKEKPAVTIFVVIHEPRGAYYGGSVAAPCFRRIAERLISLEGLEYFLEEADQMADLTADNLRLVPNLIGLSKAEAVSLLKKNGLKIDVQGDGKIVADQNPTAGTVVETNSMVALRLAEPHLDKITMPSVKHLPVRNALNLLTEYKLSVQVIGNGVVVDQQPPPGRKMAPGDKVRLLCKESV